MDVAQLAAAATSFDTTEIALIVGAAGVGAGLMKLLPERQNLAVDSANMAVAAMKTSTDLMISQLKMAESTIHELRGRIREQDVEMQGLEERLHEELLKAVGLQAKLEELRKEYTSTPDPTS